MPSRGGAGLRPHSRLGVREEGVESDLSGRSGRKFLPGQVLRVLSDALGLQARLLRQKVSFALRQRSLLLGFRLHTPLN